MKIVSWLAGLGVVVVALAGCGEGDPEAHQPPAHLRSLTLTLEGYPDAENAAVLMADQHGYFTEAGLDVEVLHPIDSDNVPGYVASGGDDIGLLPQAQLPVSNGEGMPLIAIGSLVGKPTLAMIWPRQSKIESPGDLKGKTIAINGLPFEEGFVRALLKRAGVRPKDVEVKSVSYGLAPALIKGRADAILGSSNVEGLELQARGVKPVITPLQEVGVPSYEELVIVVKRDRLSGNLPWARGLLSAVARGRTAAIEDPAAAAAAIAVARRELELPAAKPKLVEAKVEATLPLLSETTQMSPKTATHLAKWMHEEGLVERELPAAALLTNRYN